MMPFKNFITILTFNEDFLIMSQKYLLRVDEVHEFELSEEDIRQLDLVSLSKGKYHMLDQNKSFDITLVESDFLNRNYTVRINENLHKIAISTPLDALIKKMGLSLGSSKTSDDVYAPMPGIILEVQVQEGDKVSQGDYLCVLEAMKMENALTAPRDGIIKSVQVAKGDTVEKGKLLIEFEKDDK